jgi:nuclear pore complex protein Nup160
LQKNKANVVYTPYGLIERVLAAAHEGEEKDDGSVQRKAEALREAVGRRKDGMRKL